jgi:K+-transporting ATPase ATPase B chain
MGAPPLDGLAEKAEVVPFNAETRTSGVFLDGTRYFKGAVDSIVGEAGGVATADLAPTVDRISREGGTPLALLLDQRIVGDNPLTAATIAHEAGVDEFVAQAKPEDKIRLIRETQVKGHLAMNSGTTAAKEAANLIDLDSNPTKLIEVVAIGKQLLITRGAITTFSITNDVAKYFAIIPAAFAVTYPALNALNVMHWQRLRAPSCRRSSSTRW